MDEQNDLSQGELPREQIPPEGGPSVPDPLKPAAEDPEPPLKTGPAPAPAPKVPPKVPTQEASSGTKNKPKLLRPTDPSQNDQLEPISWDTETVVQRTTCVSLEDYLAASPVACGYIDQRVVNTARNANAIAAFRALLEVAGQDSEIYRQESYYSGPRVGVEYRSILDLNPIPGNIGDSYPTLSSTPIAENTMIRALRGTASGAEAIAGGGHTLWSPSRAEASIRSILAATGLVNTTSLMGYQWCLIMCTVLTTRYYSLRYPTRLALNGRLEFDGNLVHNNFVVYPAWMALNAYEHGLDGALKGTTIFIHATESEIRAFAWTILFLTRVRFQYRPLANQVHPFIGAINGLEQINVVFISLDTLVMRAGPDVLGPGALQPGAIVPLGTAVFLPSSAEIEGAIKLLARGLPNPSGVKLGWVMAQTFFARWSLMGYTVNNSAGNNPPLTCFATLSSHDIPRGSTHVTVFRSAVWDFSQQERMTHSFLDLAARHWATLEGVLGIATSISTMFTRALVVAMKALSMPLWHMVDNPEIQIIPAGEEDTRPLTTELLTSPAAGEPCEFGKMMMGIISDVYGITFDAWCFLPVGRHLLNLGDEANRLPTAVSDSRLLIDPLPPRMTHVFSQANFIGNECQSQIWNKKSSLTYSGANIAPNLRLRVVNAVLGANHSRNSTLAIQFLPRLVDPGVWIILQAIEACRRYLIQATPTDRALFCSVLSRHNGVTTSCRGPAGCLKHYLLRLGWTVTSEGTVHVSPLVSLSLHTSSKQSWVYWANWTWQQELLSHCDRKALAGCNPINLFDTRSVLHKLSAGKFARVLQEISGAFQVASQKQKWDPTASPECNFCPSIDTRHHRVFDCPATAHIRVKHQD